MTAAQRLAAVPRRGVVVVTTGSASRAWISEHVVESDGPAGAAVLARALSLGLDVVPVVSAEVVLHEPLIGLLRAAGLVPVTLDGARRATLPGGRLSVVVLRDYPLGDDESRAAAEPLVDELRPDLLLATERPGRSASGIPYNARGVDCGAGKARLDDLFLAAARRGLPTIGVGDGGNAIGMGLIADAVRRSVHLGERIGAMTPTNVLVTAAVSNWGCYAIVACLAIVLGNPDLLHTPADEERLLRGGVGLGLINSPQGRVDPHVDAIPLSTHLAIVELLRELAVRGMRQ